MRTNPVPRPFLKWAGGKAQLLDRLARRAPLWFMGYHEPFVGGGALFFRLCREHRTGRASISDLNAELMDTYATVRDKPEDVVKMLSHYPHDKNFYYRLRSEDPWGMELEGRAARMIYLNKTGYNGLYRVNRRGEFNVPFGRYRSPHYCDPANLRAVSEALGGVEILCAPFEKVVERARAGDFVYFDPPYLPVSSTAKFTAYQAGGFSEEDQARLRDVCIELSQRNVSVMISNSDTDTTRRLYRSAIFTVAQVQASRAINCNAGRRGKVCELIITNYPANAEAQLTLLESRAAYGLSPSAK